MILFLQFSGQVFCRVMGCGGQRIIHAIKRLAISTGPLKVLLPLHFQPIDLMVYQGPSTARRQLRDLILRGASRLDAFSGYPFPA